MATIYGKIENCKRKLQIASDDLTEDTYLGQLQKEVSAYMNDRLRLYIDNPETAVTTDESLDRIAVLFIVGFFLTERAPLQRQGRRLGREMEADFRVARAEFEFNHYLASKYGGASTAKTASDFDRIDGEGISGAS